MTYESIDLATILKEGIAPYVKEVWISSENGIPQVGSMVIDGETYFFNAYDLTPSRPLYTYATVSPLVLESVKENWLSPEGAYSQHDAQIFVETYDEEALIVSESFFKNLTDEQVPQPLPKELSDTLKTPIPEKETVELSSKEEEELASIIALLTGDGTKIIGNGNGTATITFDDIKKTAITIEKEEK